MSSIPTLLRHYFDLVFHYLIRDNMVSRFISFAMSSVLKRIRGGGSGRRPALSSPPSPDLSSGPGGGGGGVTGSTTEKDFVAINMEGEHQQEGMGGYRHDHDNIVLDKAEIACEATRVGNQGVPKISEGGEGVCRSSSIKRGLCTLTSSDADGGAAKKNKVPELEEEQESFSKKKSKKKKWKNREEEERGGEGKSPRSRPNHFVSLRITDKGIVENIRDLQERMMSRPLHSASIMGKGKKETGKLFKSCLIDPEKLHFTLHVMGLKEEEDFVRATQSLQSAFEKVKEDFFEDPVCLNIKGLGHFRNSVLFAKLHEEEHIRRVEGLASLVREEFSSAGFVGDGKAFQPHMTIAKMSKARNLAKNKKLRFLPRELWEEDEKLHFGQQRVEALELLSMTETDPVTKYYKCVAEFKFFQEDSISQENKNESLVETNPEERKDER